MNNIIRKIHRLVAVLCAVCLLSACSSSLDDTFGETIDVQSLTNIEVGDFPAFDSETGNGTLTRSANIGTYDAGKSKWEDGDEILLKFYDADDNVATAKLVYNGETWTLSQTVVAKISVTQFDAYYAPAYEWTNNTLSLKEGKNAGTEEYLSYSAKINKKESHINITFPARQYSRLRVATFPESKVTIFAAGFTPVGSDEALGTDSVSTQSDVNGNAFFYGTWTIGSCTIKSDGIPNYGRIKDKSFTLPAFVKAKSYALNTWDKEFEGRPFIDLGLPSGTLWATYNVGANSPEEYGNFYAWGETNANKDTYTWENYLDCRMTNLLDCGKELDLLKDYADNNATVSFIGDSRYDATCKEWGGVWVMPTIEQFVELYNTDNCDREWITNYNGSSISGYLFKSRRPGYTDNSIFLPAAGYKTGTSHYAAQTGGSYWSASAHPTEGPVYVQSIWFFNGYCSKTRAERFSGNTIRAVVRE